MRCLFLSIVVFFSLEINAQAENIIVSSALQDARDLILQEKYHQAFQRLKDVEDFRVFEDSIKYYYDKISSLEGKYDYEGDVADSGLRFVVRKGRCGYIDASGKEIVPIKYDYEKGMLRNGIYIRFRNEEYVEKWFKHYPLVRIRINGKYGFVDQKGREIVPPKYEETHDTYFWNRLSVMKVRLGDRYGFINSEGKEVVPCIYQDVKGKDFLHPYVVKKDGKYAYMDKNGKILTDFQYSSADYTFGFGISKKMAAVCKDGKYGFINELGQEVIPLQYQYADTFHEGLAAVVKDNKVGFINENGEVVIPFIYEVAYSNDSDGRCLTWSSFNDGNTILKKNGKWGIIDKQGNPITEFKYDWCSSCSYLGDYEMTCSGKTVYVNILGHEYSTKNERDEQFSKAILEAAEKGNSEAQWYVSRNYYYQNGEYAQDFKKSYEWCVKAANAGVRQAMDALGMKYYYGKGCEENLSEAFKWFSKAADGEMLNSMYFLGWMYEHGQGIYSNKEVAIKYYKQAALRGHTEAIERLKSMNINTDELTIDDYSL